MKGVWAQSDSPSVHCTGVAFFRRPAAQGQALHIWGACALPGGHASDSRWRCCDAHVLSTTRSCNCGGRAPHQLVALGCHHGCRDGVQRSNVWAALPGNVKAITSGFGAPANDAISSAAVFYGQYMQVESGVKNMSK